MNALYLDLSIRLAFYFINFVCFRYYIYKSFSLSGLYYLKKVGKIVVQLRIERRKL